jgi:CRISPR-associated DxTHG motif protein
MRLELSGPLLQSLTGKRKVDSGGHLLRPRRRRRLMLGACRPSEAEGRAHGKPRPRRGRRGLEPARERPRHPLGTAGADRGRRGRRAVLPFSTSVILDVSHSLRYMPVDCHSDIRMPHNYQADRGEVQ